jgi:hypothetical protein
MTRNTVLRKQISTRIGIFAGLLFLSIITLAIFRSHREGNGYVTFGTLWASGHAAQEGHNPYAAYPETFRAVNYTKTGIDGTMPDLNLNPPWTLPFVQGLARAPLARFKQIWVVLSGVCFFAGIVLLIVGNPNLQGRQVVWFALASPTLETLSAGQVYGWAFLFGVIAWFCQQREKIVGAGVAIGIVIALRPTMAFWLLVLLLSGFRKLASVSFATVAALYSAALVVYGPQVYGEWFRALAGDRHWMNPCNIAIIPTWSRLGYPHAGVALAACVALAVCIWVWRSRPGFIETSGAGLCLGILCAPLAWYHYVLFVAPFLMVRRWGPLTAAGAFLFLLPVINLSDAVQGIIYLSGTFLLLAGFAWLGHEKEQYAAPSPNGEAILIKNG